MLIELCRVGWGRSGAEAGFADWRLESASQQGFLGMALQLFVSNVVGAQLMPTGPSWHAANLLCAGCVIPGHASGAKLLGQPQPAPAGRVQTQEPC